MSTQIVGTSFAKTTTPSTTLSVLAPVDDQHAALQEGDLLIAALVVASDASHDATNLLTLALPVGWNHAGYTQTTTNRIVFAFKYVGVGDTSGYTFTYLSARMMVCVVIAIRGASRDWDTFTPTLTPTNFVLPATPYPNGFFAPRGSVGAAVTGVGSHRQERSVRC
jgi:hypothetical protein